MLKCAFTHIFSMRINFLGCRKCLIGMVFDRKPDTLLSWTLYRTRVAEHDILKVCEEDAMNDALFAPLSHYRESQQADRHIKKKRYRASKLSQRRWSSGRDRMKPSDFDKCEMCINSKNHTQTRQQTIPYRYNKNDL